MMLLIWKIVNRRVWSRKCVMMTRGSAEIRAYRNSLLKAEKGGFPLVSLMMTLCCSCTYMYFRLVGVMGRVVS